MNNRKTVWESDSYLKLYKNGYLKYSGRMTSGDAKGVSGSYYKRYYITL